jgi:hypothetical protein
MSEKHFWRSGGETCFSLDILLYRTSGPLGYRWSISGLPVIRQETKRKMPRGPESGGHFRVEMNLHFTNYLVVDNSGLCWPQSRERTLLL